MAKSRRNAKVKLLGVVRRRRPALLVSTALCATVSLVISLPAVAQPAPNALPTGFVARSPGIAAGVNGNTETVTQTTQRGAADWTSFNVGSQAQVQFNQPSSSSVTLNRVVGPNPSQIAGKIDANGQIIIENQSGVMFYNGSQVNTAGLMVSAAASNKAAMQAFLNGGNLVMDRAAHPNAAVVNQGHITIKQAGLAALVAPQVVNSGVITARLGHVVLAGATRTTLDLYGDGMMSIDVTGQVATLPNGATALVTNSGIIVADGGTVQLTARAADGLVTTLVDAGGKIQANSVGGHVGTVTLNGVGGGITVEGQLDAMGKMPGTTGGSIEVNATGNVTVASAARINASGQAGGGLIAIGTTLKRSAGGPSVTTRHTAANVTVQPGATIAANATHSGSGGRVTVLSTTSTDMAGSISATGGPEGGNGGFVEVSGNQAYALTGMVDVSAPRGTIGTILLDPTNLFVISGTVGAGDQDGNFTGGTLATGASDTANDTVSNGELQQLGSLGNVLLQASKTIDVGASFSLTAGGLTMEAGQLISIDSGVSVGASGDIILATGGAGPGTPPAAQTIPTITIDGSLASSGGSVGLLAGVGGSIVLGNAGLVQAANSKTVTLQGDSMAFNNGKVIATGGTIEIAPATSGNAIAFSATGTTTLTVPTLQPGSVVASVLRLGAVTIGGTLTTTAGSITFDKSVNLTGVASTLDVETTGTVSQTSSGTLTAGTLTGNVTGEVSLDQAENNHIGTVGSFNAGGVVFALITTGAVTVAGPVVAPAIQIENDTNPMSVTGSLGATVLISLQTLGSLSVGTGAILNSPSVALSGVHGIALTGSTVVGQTGATVDLSATGGNVTEANTGTIIAATLQSYQGVSGTADLRGTANAIGSIGTFAGFAVTNGDFLLTDTTPLTIKGALSAGGSIYLQTSDPILGITVASGGTVAAGSSSLVSFQTDRFTNSGTVTGGTFELAPNTSGREVTIGGDGNLPSLNGIGPSSVRIGAVTVPGTGLTTTAGSIVVIGTFGVSTVALELDSTGGIDGSGFALTASTLSGSAATATSGDANFSATNTIGTLGNFVVGGSASSGNFNLVDTGPIVATGSVSAANATVNAGTISINSGSIVTSGTGSLDLTSTAGAIALTGPALLNGGTVGLSSATGITQSSTSTIIATSLTASAAAGGIVLDSLTNAIGTVTGMSAIGGGVTLVVDPTMVLTGPITGDDLFFEVAHNGGTLQIGDTATGATLSATAASNPTVSLVADNVTEGTATSTLTATDGSNGGTVEIAPFTSATAVFLGVTSSAGGLGVDQTLLGDITTGTGGLLRIGEYTGTVSAGDISIASSVNLGGVASTLELDSASGSITEAASIVLTAATLTGTAAGNVTLFGSNNAVGTLGSFVTSGNFALVDDASTLSVAGLVQSTASGGSVFIKQGSGQELDFVNGGSAVVTNGTIGLVADTLTAAASGVTIAAGSSGTIEFAPSSTATALTLSNGNAFSAMSAGVLRIGAYHDASNGGINVVSAASIDIAASLSLTAVPVLDLNSTGLISEAASVALAVATLTGSAAAVGLLGTTNAIGTLGVFNTTSGFALVDNEALLVNGPVTDTGASSTLALTTLTGGITLAGNVSATNLLDLTSAGTISQTDGSISALMLTGTATSAGLTQATNLVGTLGAFSTTAGFALTDNEALTVSGPVTDTGASSTLALTTKTGGITLDGTVSATNVLDLLSAGTISQPGGSISAGTLTGSATAASLTQPTNVVGTLGAFSTTMGFELVNSEALLVNGPVSDIGASSTLALITMTGGITLAGDVSAANLLDLTSAGTITQTGGSISALTLTGSATSAGLTQANLVGTLGAFSTTAGFALIDNEALLVNGPVTDTGASSTLALTTTIGGITLAGAVSATNVLDLVSAGSIDQTGGSISAGTLIGSASALASLLQPTNAVGTLGAFTVTGGDLLLVDNSNLTIAGAVEAADIFAKIDLAGGTLTLGDSTTGATLNASGTISLVADNITEGSATNTITALGRGTGGTVDIAPFTSGTPVSLGASPATGTGTLVVDTTLLADISTGATGTLRIGSYNDLANGGTLAATAGNISVDGPVSLTGSQAGTLRLDSTGSTYESGANGIEVATLVGSAVAGVTLASSNTIATLGSFTAGGTFDLVDTGAPSLAVTGPVTAAGVTITGADTTAVTGTVTGASGSNIFVASGSISLAGGVLTGGTVDINGIAGGISESLGGSIVAGTLMGSLGSTGNVDLGDANSVGTLANFLVNSGTFHLDNGGTVGLAVNGAVIASGVTLDNVGGTLAINGTILGGSIVGSSTFATGLVLLAGTGPTSVIDLNTGSSVDGATIELNTGSVVMSGSALLGDTLALIEVTTTGGGVNEAGTATILAATLEGLGAIDGNVILAGAGNTIAAISSLAVTNAGTFSLTDNGNLGVGTLTASAITIADAGTLTVTDSLVATSAVGLTASTILIPGEASDGGAGTTSLVATGGSIVEGGTLFAGTLSGSSTGATSLTGNTNTTNQVANLGSFTATGGFTLDDGTALAVAGPVNGGASATILDAAALTVNGSVFSSGAISLTGSSIAINGSAYVSDGGTGSSTTSLIATNGSIVETGTLIAGTLSGSSTGATSLTGATDTTNQILNLGSFTATGGLVLEDGATLAVAGPVNGGASATILDAQALTVNGSLFSTSVISLTGSSIAVTGAGYVSDGGAGTTSLIATNGTINETGTLIAGTLSGRASNGGTVSTAVNLAGASAITNQVGTLGSFIASSFNLDDGTNLAVNGRLGDDTSVTITLPSTAALTINGTIIPVVLSGSVPSATNVSLTAGSITIPGTVSDGGAGTTSLVATNGSTGETGTLIAGALSGSSTGATSLTGATAITNHVGTLGSFSAAGFVLDDGAALTVAGAVNGGTSATILDAQALTVNGSVYSTSAISLTGSSIAITGTGYVSDGGSGTTSLIATSGTIGETGTLIAGTLSGSSTGATGLTGATTTVNRVANLGNFSASSFALDDGIALAVAGPVNGGSSASILDAAALMVSGSVVSTSAISLTGSSIAITGTGYVSDGGAGTTSLVATNGTISETGTLIAGTLSGSSTGATSLAGATTTVNHVANLGSFSADGFLLNDGIALAVAGPVNGGTSATILDAQALTVNGSLFSTSAISLTGSSIAITGTGYVSDGGVGTTSLIATSGTINEIGTLIAGTLSGSSTGTTTLTGATTTTNQVANLGAFSVVPGPGDFILDDGTSLTVVSSVVGNGNITITDMGGVTINAPISFFANTSISATGSITNNSEIGVAAGNVMLSAGSSITNNDLISGLQNGTLSAGADISNNGSIGFGGNATLIAVGSINDASDGVITAGNISGVGSTVLLVAQTGSISEASGGTIAATDASTANVQFTAQSTTGGNIVVAGAITASGSLGVVGLTAGGSITQSGGSIVAGGPGTIGGTLVPSISLVAQTGTIGQSAGAVISATNAAGAIQVAAHGNITFAGTISAPSAASIVSLASGATIAETAASGILQAGTLIGSAGDGASLTATSGNGNLVADLGSFTTGTAGAGDFVLLDGQSLTVLAPVVADRGSIAITGTHFGTLAASSLINNSTIQASSNVTLLADDNVTNTGSVLAQGGTVTVTASAGTLATSGLVQASTNATLLADGNLTNTGSVIATNGDVSMTSTTGTITNNFAGAAHGNATLMAGADISNTLVSVGVNALLSAGGSIGNTSVVAGGDATLTAGGGITNSGVSADGSASLTASTLDIANIGSGVAAAAGSATLTATVGNITTSAGISAGTAASLTAGSSVTNTSSVIAQGGTVSVTATAGTLATSGLVQASTNATLLADGNLTNTGSVIATNGDVSMTSTTGTITNNFVGAAHGNATLTAGADLINTLVSVGANALLSAGGSIGNTSVVAGGNATLTAGGGITNSGVSAGGSASLTASTLDIANMGSGVAATAGSATLAATLGNITTSAGVTAGTAASLTAGGNVTNTSSVIAHGGTVSVTATAGTLATSGLIEASTNATLLAGTDLTNTGSVIAQTGNASLTTSAGALINGGLVQACTNATLLAHTDLTNASSVIAQTGSASLSASTGTLTNGGLVQANTNTTLQADTDLTNTGSVIAQTGSASLSASMGTLTNGGLVRASTDTTLQAGTNLTNTSSVIAQGGSASLTASTGTLTNGGLVQANTSATLLAGTDLTNTGSVVAQTTYAWLTATAGTLTNGGLVQASTNTTLQAGTNLTNTGSVIAQNSSASLTASAGALTNNGLILASTSATLLAGTDLTNTGSVIAQTSYASLTASAGALTNGGLIRASTNTTLLAGTNLTNTGSVIAQTGNATLTASFGTVSPGALSNSGLISAPAIGAVVALTANNGPIIQSGGSAAIVAGGSVVMNATGGITLNGLVSDDTGVSLNSGGAIYQYGTLIADLLTGSAGGTVDLAGATSTTNQVANLGNFTAAGTFTLNDGINLLISGVVNAAKIIINDGIHTISLGNGGFDTDGVNRPQGALTASQLPTAASTTPGAYLAAGSVIQTGSSFTVDNTHSGQESILSITLPVSGSGTLQFSSGGLVAPNTWLILSVGNGAASGPIYVKALDFAYSLPPGRADFTGLINGLSGPAAAATAFIQPLPNPSFRVDGCPIHSVNCLLLATEGVPAAPPLGEINVGAPLNQQNPEDLVLPVVSDERYELVPCDDPTQQKACPAVNKPSPLR